MKTFREFLEEVATIPNNIESPGTTTLKQKLKRGAGIAGKGLKGAFGVSSAIDAVQSARQGDYGGAAQSALLAGASSNRLNQGAAALGRKGVQSAASKLGLKGAGKVAAKLVPGLQTAYGVARGTSALSKGDYLGAGLGYASAVPGPVGWVATAGDVARDVYMPFKKEKSQISQVQSAKKTPMSGVKNNGYGTRQGSAIMGIGGQSIVNRQAKTITSGGRTASLAPTGLIRDPKTGKQTVGDLAFKGGKAVYLARPSIASRDTNLFSRISRATGIGGQRERDAAAAKREYRTALKSTQARTKQLGITPQAATRQKLPGYGVGPKKVGPKIVGPKKVGAAKPVSPGSTLIKPA